ncbi:MAG: YMGG-like glycine zipper-containing protein [Candidatus Omnitrophica bacterium]|nr:YMGG-like glycine zipper-containing protein [Candidatus Omnitrophota bacterium]
MKKLLAVILSAGLMFAALGCETNKTRVAEGAGIGGALGALAGGIIGHQGGHGVEGALIGAAAGAATGAVVGSQINKPGTANQLAASQQTVSPNQMTTQQIVDLSKQKVNDAVIIDKIKLTNSKFVLTPADVDNLKSQGVSAAVISAMQGA